MKSLYRHKGSGDSFAIETDELLSEAEYGALLKQTGFFVQESQRTIFDEMSRAKRLCRRRRRK